MNTKPRLVKSKKAIFAGVCGGFAQFIGWTPASVRFLWATLTVITGVLPGFVLYTLLAVAMPSEESDDSDSFRLEDFRAQ